MAQENVTEAFFAKTMMVKSSYIKRGPKIITKYLKSIAYLRRNSAKFSQDQFQSRNEEQVTVLYVCYVYIASAFHFFCQFSFKSTSNESANLGDFEIHELQMCYQLRKRMHIKEELK